MKARLSHLAAWAFSRQGAHDIGAFLAASGAIWKALQSTGFVG